MKTYRYELRSMPAWLMQQYLHDLGGLLQEDGSFKGTGWQAKIDKMPDFQIGSLKVGQIMLEWQGDDQAVKDVLPLLETKMLRAGG